MRLAPALALLLAACGTSADPNPAPLATNPLAPARRVVRLSIGDVCNDLADSICVCAAGVGFRTCVWRYMVSCCAGAERCAIPTATTQEDIDLCRHDLAIGGCDAATLPMTCAIAN